MSENQAAQVHEEAPTRLELEQGDIYSKYLLYSKSEILFVLRAVLQKGSMITVYFDRGQSFLLTSLIAIDTDRSALIFDLGSDNEMNERALKADRLLFTTSLDKVKIQFSLKRLSNRHNTTDAAGISRRHCRKPYCACSAASTIACPRRSPPPSVAVSI